MKKLMILGVFILMACLMAACGNSEDGNASGAEKSTLRYGHSAPPTDPGGVIADKIAADTAEATGGEVAIEVFPSGQLGGEVEIVEQLRSGSVDMAFVTGGALSNFVPDIAVLDMPFLFDDLDHAKKVLNGEVGNQIKEKAAEEGFQILGFYDYGEGHLANTKQEIKEPVDLKGLQMRTLENDIFMDTFKALGADPVPMPFPEVYSAIQQGVVDGTDPVNVAMIGGKLFEVTDYYTEISLNYRSGILLMNKDKFDGLEEETKTELETVVQDSIDHYHSVVYPEYEESVKETLTDNDVKIVPIEDVDREAFVEAVQPVYEQHEARFGDLVERIQNEK
ncbi:TRAP transporter substrate-binding protein [Planococcus sp. SE5232]|uniref:TRAP transporter substrate-binding protein n=1 Tax=unclassified Planococcus (in: firmicutes) TaxID=2662419 RepID=UPI003D6C2E11